jgi:hypothetical protein
VIGFIDVVLVSAIALFWFGIPFRGNFALLLLGVALFLLSTLGIGLFIFLWAITGEFGLGCIGLLVMFTGFGQLVIFYSQQKKNEEK